MTVSSETVAVKVVAFSMAAVISFSLFLVACAAMHDLPAEVRIVLMTPPLG